MCFALGTPACYLAPPPSPFWTQDNYRPAYVRIARNVLRDVASRALQLHGSLGLSSEMPFGDQVLESFHMALADGPTEVHKITVARQVLRDYEGTTDLFPDYTLPNRRAAALAQLSDQIERDVEAW